MDIDAKILYLICKTMPHLVESFEPDNDAKMFFIESGGFPLSMSGYCFIDGKCYLSWTATDPNYQKLGLAKSLIKMVENDILELKVTELYVQAQNKQGTLNFYRSCGFKVIGRDEPFLLMRKDI